MLRVAEVAGVELLSLRSQLVMAQQARKDQERKEWQRQKEEAEIRQAYKERERALRSQGRSH
jgi:hypothetical protein